jgi:hypothetical protein
LKDVGDLVVAAITEPARRLLGLPQDHGPLTLHYAMDEEALEVDTLLSALNTGTTAKTALIIKSRNDVGSDIGNVVIVDDKGLMLGEKKVTFEETVLKSLKYLEVTTKTLEVTTKNLEVTTKTLEVTTKNLEVTTKKNGHALEPLVQDFIKKFYYTNDTRTKASRGDNFKKCLLFYYYGIQEKVDEIKCMISGLSFPSKLVIAGHLFKYCWAKYCEERLDFSDIDNPRNGLLLFKPFEFAFDNSHICFHYDADAELFQLKILHPALKGMTIREYIKSEDEIDESSLLKSREQWIASLSNVPGIDMSCVSIAVDNLLAVLDKPFAEFEGYHVRSGLDRNRKCFGRCLSFQATMAQHLAVCKGWISADEVSSPMFSALAEEKQDQILAWMGDLSSRQFLPTLAIDE